MTNHRSIRDSTELVLTKSSFEGVRPADGDWKSVTNRIVGIFGSNASGKTNLLHAIHFALDAIRKSAAWGEEEKFPYHPFILDSLCAHQTSAYEFDFTLDEIRYEYGFESDVEGVKAEWLATFPEGRRRVLFERSGPEPGAYTFGRFLKGENVRISRMTGPKNLFLSVAAKLNHAEAKRVHRRLTRHIQYAAYSETQQQGRISAIKKWMESDSVRQKAESLLKFADLGISRLAVEDVELSPEMRKMFTTVAEQVFDTFPNARVAKDDFLESFLADQQRKIKFWHKGGDGGKNYVLDIESESSGTVAWLSLAIPAIRAIDNGQVFVVDEIDASLHPRLTAAFISLFRDTEINTKGAQLIFASHDTSLMGHLAGGALGKEDVWFAEKGVDGASEYFPLTDFPVKADHNLERRYLSGRYGAVPAVSWEDLRASLVVGDHE
ncbi:ATP-binding protein [Streptomyces sp. NPDC052020]|uniref:AAA family ATPase n=1 Tax=Streptomyces sp. NPDC052020 TaxID=3155677 RepID=UPI0034222ED6